MTDEKKPAATKPAPVATKTEPAAPAPKSRKPSKKIVDGPKMYKVKNISNKTLNLNGDKVDPGETGKATKVQIKHNYRKHVELVK